MKIPKTKDEVSEIINKLLLLATFFVMGEVSQIHRVREAGEQAFRIGHSIGADRCSIKREPVPGYLGQDSEIAANSATK